MSRFPNCYYNQIGDKEFLSLSARDNSANFPPNLCMDCS